VLGAVFLLDISIGASSDSSPPIPIISGAVLTNDTESPFARFGFAFSLPLNELCRPAVANPALGLLAEFSKSFAEGHRCAAAISMRGLGVWCAWVFCTDGLRKSSTSAWTCSFWASFARASSGVSLALPRTQRDLLRNLFLMWRAVGSSAMAEVEAEDERAVGGEVGTRRPCGGGRAVVGGVRGGLSCSVRVVRGCYRGTVVMRVVEVAAA
jgi:hypothetical protein